MTTSSTDQAPLQARPVRFDLGQTPLHWLPHDPEAAHTINVIHMLLPEGEFWFCRVYNKALPLVRDERLRADVHGFIRQEASHARAHSSAVAHYLHRHHIDTTRYMRLMSWLFKWLLADQLLGSARLGRLLERWWLRQRVCLIAAIEHFTCVLGRWVVEAEALEAPGTDPVMLDLCRWHGAEEVEHRNVAHDLHVHIGGSVAARQAWMFVVIPALLILIAYGVRYQIAQDASLTRKRGFFRIWWRSAQRGTLPSIAAVLRAVLRYFNPRFHPDGEAPLQLAQAYFARSPAVQAALAQPRP